MIRWSEETKMASFLYPGGKPVLISACRASWFLKNMAVSDWMPLTTPLPGRYWAGVQG